jgi:hypothetical protein
MSLGVLTFENGKNDQIVDVTSLAAQQTTDLHVESPALKLEKAIFNEYPRRAPRASCK